MGWTDALIWTLIGAWAALLVVVAVEECRRG